MPWSAHALRQGGLGPGGEHEDARGLARPVGQDTCAADHLIRVLGVHAQVHGDVDGLVETVRAMPRFAEAEPVRMPGERGAGELAAAGRIAAFAGALLFYISDIFVARQRFLKAEFVNRLIGLPLYYGGQFMLAFSIGWLSPVGG